MVEVVSFVVNDDKGGEVFDADFVDRFHAKLWKSEDFHVGDAVASESCGRPSDGSQIEAAVGAAGVEDSSSPVAFGEHDA